MVMFFNKKSQLKELCLLKYPWDIHTFLKTLLSQCHEVEFCLLLNHCCVSVQSDVLRVLMIFKFVEVRYFCVHIHLHAYTVTLKTLTALQSTIHDGLNGTLIPNFIKWGCQIKRLYWFTLQVFSLPYKAPALTPPGFCSEIHLFHLLFLLPWLDMFRKWIQSIM